MISVFIRQRGGSVTVAESLDPALLLPASGAVVWVDLAAPTEQELGLLSHLFHFHPLAVEDATSALQFPKVEGYPGYLYLVLHGIDVEAVWEQRGKTYPRGRALSAGEVADTISSLASDAAAGINGEAVTVALGGLW